MTMASLKVPVSRADHIQGSENAPITLVEYGDYECPFCGAAYYVIKQLQKHFGKQLRFVFRNFPLTQIHPYAEIAAEAAEFAGLNNQFWEMHDLIYENQSSLNGPFLLELGTALGLDARELAKAIETRAFEDKIKNDFLGGVKSGVNGTPTFFINGERYNGSYEYPELEAALESLLVK
jgi:protein-disulfide isomerase